MGKFKSGLKFGEWTVNSLKKTVAEWAEELRTSQGCLYCFLKNNTFEEAVKFYLKKVTHD